jgi:hypothetical protein
MKKFALLSVLSIMFIFAATAFSQDSNIPAPHQTMPAVPQDGNYVVMTLDENNLTIGQMKFFTPNLDLETVKSIADYWLNTQLLYEEAVRSGIDKDAKTKFLADIGYKKAIATALVEKAQSGAEITDEQVQKYYDENKETDVSLKEPNYLSFSHITVETIEKAQDVKKRIEAGEEINKLAMELSVANDAKKGGTANKYQEKTVLVRFGKEFLDALNKASEGNIIGPVKNKDGKYEIARHEGKRLARVKEFDKVKEEIKANLQNQAERQAVENLLNSLKEKAKGRYKKMGILADANDKSEKKRD